MRITAIVLSAFLNRRGGMGGGLCDHSRRGDFHRLAQGSGSRGCPLLMLAIITAAGGFLLARVDDLRGPQFAAGMFLTAFGVWWLGKAVARGAGLTYWG